MSLLPIVMLVVPSIAREWAHWVSTHGQPKGYRVGGLVSVCIWIPCHWTLLVLAFRALLHGPILLQAWIGYAIYCMAILLRIAAVRVLGRFYSPDVVIRTGHQVIEDGPYRWIRHPLHTALMFEMLGLWTISGVWYGGLLLLLSFLAHLVRSRREEVLLEQHLGDSYRRYRNRTWDALDLFPGRQKP